LLHGDLWTFNLLVAPTGGGRRITGVLDTERAWWGDPLADWIIFLLSLRSEERQWVQRVAAFQDGYGTIAKSTSARFRLETYKAMHIGSSAVWGLRHGQPGDVERAREDLNNIASTLPTLLG
jgi:aminoglycoside phosphotransferase (APT) family kinase protein